MTQKAIGLVSVNSLQYVQRAFVILNEGKAFVGFRSPDDSQAVMGLDVSDVIPAGMSHGWYDGPAYTPVDSENIALIAYTSGTEGKPKGVMISHAALGNTTERLIKIMKMDGSIREYVGIPVNYSFGFGRCRAVSLAGGQFFLPQNGFNPLEIVEMLEAGEINSVSAVPSLWRLVLETPEIFRVVADRLKWIEIGSQYMSAEEKKQLRELFPKAIIIQHYGLTEASRSTFLEVHDVGEAELESVGKGYFGVEVGISDEGKIRIRGPHLASALLIEGQVQQITDSDGWLETSDSGHFQNDHLYFDGRMDDLINLGGTKLSPESLEAFLVTGLSLEPGKLAVFKSMDSTMADQVNVAVLEEADADEAAVRACMQQALQSHGLRSGRQFPVYRLKSFPLTDTGKVRRKALAELISQKLPTSSNEAEGQSSTPYENKIDELVKIWEEILNIHPISPKDSFFDLGGDSLSAIRVTLRMEKAGLPKDACRRIFEGCSIETLVASTGLSQEKQPPADTAGEHMPAMAPRLGGDGTKGAANSKAQELISIWQDVLKIDDISEYESFFDLGGDSLSAIRVIVRMESAGIPKEVCRKIFEGKSILDIVGSHAGTESPLPIENDVTPASDAKAEALINIWEDVLKIENVSMNDSFFDLGGDSLSAIRVVVRMEAAGIPKQTCRMIFEGKSIREIAGHGESGALPPKGFNGSTSKERGRSDALISIWKEVLKIDNLTEDDSFFDLGGDSLSAIRVVVRMEAAGVPKEACRRIFEGKSIREIVSGENAFESTESPTPDPIPEVATVEGKNGAASVKDGDVASKRRTPIASANLALNVVRGALVLMNIVAHWMPGVIALLPSSTLGINKYLSPLYSSGTPGFALVFGAGISFFIVPRFWKNKASVNKLCVRNALLLGSGITCMAVVSIASMYFSGETISPTDISNSFYSVLFYYFFAVISIPFWLRLLTWKGSYKLSCLSLSILFYGAHLLIDSLGIAPSDNPFIQTGILILTPKYNYLEMTSAVMLGAAAGAWIKDMIDAKGDVSPLLAGGTLLAVLAVFISIETGEQSLWFTWPKGLYLWTWPFYLGCILVAFYFLYRYIVKHDIDTHPVTGFVLRVVSIVGVMAFPLFIGHELVRPMASLLSALSVPGGLVIAMLLFAGYSAFLLRKLYMLYYASSN